MATLTQSIKKLKSFDFEKAILKVVKDNDNVAIDLNTDSQLGEKGIDSKGNLLPGPYAPFTIDQKAGLSRFGGITDHITLYHFGSFHEGFFMDTSKFDIMIDSSDSKTPKLKSDWGEDIMGLTQDSQSEFNNHILPDIQSALKNGIGI